MNHDRHKSERENALRIATVFLNREYADGNIVLISRELKRMAEEIDGLQAELAAKDARVAELTAVKIPSGEINAMPERVRSYIAALETACDPSGTIRDNYRLTEENRGLRTECSSLFSRAERAEARIAKLEAANTALAKRAVDATFWANQTGDKCADANARAEAELAEVREQLHYVNGVADLAIQHRDAAEAQLANVRDFVRWVDSWVSNPVGAYSVCALDGLFGMTRDKIAALAQTSSKETQEP
jgi:predicted  nucleic acid-binding Zn-ribbon protein